MVTRFLLPALAVAAVVIAAVVSAAGEETRVELEYLGSIRGQAEQLALSGTSVADVMSRVDQIGRDEFTTVFSAVGADLDEAQAFVGEEPPTDSLIPVWALYRQAVTAWDRGTRGLAQAILQAADDPDDMTAIDSTVDAIADLRAGDTLSQDMKAEFAREEIPDPVAPPVDVVFSPSDGGLGSISRSYVVAARRSTSQLGLHPGLAMSQVVSDPGWDVNVEGETVVPATDTVAFAAVITNSGNVASEPESATMEVTVGTEDPLAVATEEVPALQPDGQTTVEFEPLELDPDIVYEVRVALELSNPDSDLTDNERTVEFTISAG